MRSCFDKLFGHNACTLQNEIARALQRRGESTIPNILGQLLLLIPGNAGSAYDMERGHCNVRLHLDINADASIGQRRRF